MGMMHSRYWLQDFIKWVVLSLHSQLIVEVLGIRGGRVRNLKFARNLKFTTSKTLLNSTEKVMVCLKLSIFSSKIP